MRAWRDGDGGRGAGPGAHRRSADGGADELGAAVDAARHGNEAAFRTVYTLVHPGLLRYVRLLVGGAPGGVEAEDVTSEAWLQVVRDLHRFRGTGPDFRAWTATIARHRALDHVRHARRRPAYPTPVEEIPEPRTAPDAADLAIDTLSTAEAVALVASLPIDQAEAVMLRAVLGLDAVAAAKVLGKRPGAVRMAAHRGLHRLAERLKPAEPLKTAERLKAGDGSPVASQAVHSAQRRSDQKLRSDQQLRSEQVPADQVPADQRAPSHRRGSDRDGSADDRPRHARGRDE